MRLPANRILIALFLIFIHSCSRPDHEPPPPPPPTPITPTPVTPTNPVIIDSVVAIYVADGYNIFAFDGRTGIKKWGVKFPDFLAGSSLVYLDGKLLRTTGTKLYALDTAGNIKWTFQPTGTFRSAPVAADGTVYTIVSNPNEEMLYALDVASGQVKWKIKDEHLKTTTTLVNNGVVYTGSEHLAAFDGLTGTKKWGLSLQTYNNFIAGDKIYGLQNNSLYSHDLKTGVLFRKVLLPNEVIAMNMGNGFLYVLRDGRVDAFDTASFSLKWSTINASVSSHSATRGPIVRDSVLIFQQYRGIYAYNSYTGTKVWEAVGDGIIGGTYVNRTIYYGSVKTSFTDSVRLRAYDLSTKSFKWSYTMKGNEFFTYPCVLTKSGKAYGMSR